MNHEGMYTLQLVRETQTVTRLPLHQNESSVKGQISNEELKFKFDSANYIAIPIICQ